MTTINATFEVTGWDENEFDASEGQPKLTRASVTKTYHGDIEGTSVTEWVMAYAPDSTATFVGIERIRATLGERSGSFVLQHVGAFVDGAATASLTVVTGGGTDDFAPASGSGDFRADPSGAVSLELTFGADEASYGTD